MPVEIHCHGIGASDFSDVASLDLKQIQDTAAAEQTSVVLTSFLRSDQLDAAEEKLNEFHSLRAQRLIPNIVGFALEGPLLSRHGGTPPATTWRPSREQWQRIASWGQTGLLYTVLSPDVWDFEPDYAAEVPREWLVTLLMRHSVRLALGHFSRQNPNQSAAAVSKIVDTANNLDRGPEGVRVFTDHMMNDMPHNITHAFRNNVERIGRLAARANWRVAEWDDDETLADILGVVPATLMRLAKCGELSLSINFDGDHVDRELALAIAQHVGIDNVCLMTDRCELDSLAGQHLTLGAENTLLYQQGGVVAAGTKGVLQQISELLRHGVRDSTIRKLVDATPRKILAL